MLVLFVVVVCGMYIVGMYSMWPYVHSLTDQRRVVEPGPAGVIKEQGGGGEVRGSYALLWQGGPALVGSSSMNTGCDEARQDVSNPRAVPSELTQVAFPYVRGHWIGKVGVGVLCRPLDRMELQ